MNSVIASWKVVKSDDDLALFGSWLSGKPTLAIDTETAPRNPKIVKKEEVRKHSVNFRLAKLVGSSFSDGVMSWYLPFGHTTDEYQVDIAKFRAMFNQYLFNHKDFYPIFHNAKFDVKMLAKHAGIDLTKYNAFDTYVGHWYFDQESSHKLKFLAKAILKKHPKTKERMEGIDVKYFDEEFDGERLDVKPVDDVADYALKDPFFTWLLYEVIRDKLEESPAFKESFYKVHCPLINILAQAELRGILVDTDRLNQVRDLMLKELEIIESSIFESVGYPFNIRSPTQLRRVLYGEVDHGGLGLECKRWTKPSKTAPKGQKSTDSKALIKLIEQHDVPRLLLKYRKVSKRIEAFCDPLIFLIGETLSNIISPDFNICGARSGRLSCKNPNMQQIPAKKDDEEDIYDIRRLFVPRPGHTFIIFDYSQLELRVLAHISGDEQLTFAYKNDLDVHQRTADELEVDRKQGKNMQFAAVYGASGQKLADMKNEKLKPGEKPATSKQMDKLIERYFDFYHGVWAWKKKKENSIAKKGWVQTLIGRKRFLPDFKSEDRKKFFKALRAGVNTAIQGTAADIVNIAMVKCDNNIELRKLKCQLLLQVHDELLFEVPIENADKAAPIIKGIMEHPFELDLDVPLKAEGGISNVWTH